MTTTTRVPRRRQGEDELDGFRVFRFCFSTAASFPNDFLRYRASLFDQLTRLEAMCGDSNPDFVSGTISLFCTNSESAINNWTGGLRQEGSVDFKQCSDYVHGISCSSAG